MYTFRHPLNWHLCTLRLLSESLSLGLFALALPFPPFARGEREAGLPVRCWFALLNTSTGDSGELGGVSGKTGLGILLISSQPVGVGNLIFKGFTGSSIDGFVSVGVSGRTVGTEGNVAIALKSIGLMSQSSPKGKFDSSKGWSKNSFHGAGFPKFESLLSKAEGSGQRYRSISSLVCEQKIKSSLLCSRAKRARKWNTQGIRNEVNMADLQSTDEFATNVDICKTHKRVQSYRFTKPHVMLAKLQGQNHYKTHVHTYLCPIVFERGKRVEKASVVNGLKFVEYCRARKSRLEIHVGSE